ncbi:TPA_asm: SSDBP [Stylophora coral adintovirus]|nr:TPA_asm: SSDBP [Stylophora coral adintovirus]
MNSNNFKSDIVFTELEKGSDGFPSDTRVDRCYKISAKNGAVPGEMLIKTPLLFAPIGVQDESGTLPDYYTLPVRLWGNEGPTQNQLDFYESLKEIKTLCREYLDNTFGEGAYRLHMPLVENSPPVLRPELTLANAHTDFILNLPPPNHFDPINIIFHTPLNSLYQFYPLDFKGVYFEAELMLNINSICIYGDTGYGVTARIDIKVDIVYVKTFPERNASLPIDPSSDDEDEEEYEDDEDDEDDEGYESIEDDEE